MKSIIIKPSTLNGTINAPPSKSLSHRAIICASLCNKGESIIDNIILSEDIIATIEGMRGLGATIEINEQKNNKYALNIKRLENHILNANINCRESGSTLRFLIPIGLTLSKECTFTGYGKLRERPLNTYYEIFEEQQIKYQTTDGKLPLYVSGRLKGGNYNISGKISSQFITGLLFTLPLINSDSTITITDNLESKGYIDLTLDLLKKFNINIEHKNYEQFIIKGNSDYKATNYTVEGDYSQAAFFIVAKAISNNVNCIGIDNNSLQGDKEIQSIVQKYAVANFDEVVIDASQIPDLVPILAVLASLSDGRTTRIVNAQRVRIKESDRLKAISFELNKLGADIEELNDGLFIKGKKRLKGNATVNSWNDHRIAMALSIAATRCENEIILQDYTAVNKSYPGFFDDYKSLGGVVSELNLE